MVRARARRKGRRRAEPVRQDRAGHRDRPTLYVSGRNRGMDGRLYFRAEPLRLALAWSQSCTQAAARATASPPRNKCVPPIRFGFNMYNVGEPRVQGWTSTKLNRVQRSFLFGVQEPFLFSRKIEKRNGS